jgi:bacillithiol system protein YtxJ
MGWFKNETKSFWIELNLNHSVQELIDLSLHTPVIIFKHSTRCSISSMVLSRFEREWKKETKAHLFYLDLIQFRQLSNEIANQLIVEHQSPQAILLLNGLVCYSESHNGISANEILTKIQS